MNFLVDAILLYCLIAFVLNLFYFRWISQAGSQGQDDKISVLIPVRNEEKKLARCLDSLLNQSYRNLEIIVMDDHSDDASWKILSEYQAAGKLRAFRSTALPDGWSGKNWACHQLSLHATGSWLAFVDADTVHAEDSIQRAYEEAVARGASMVSYLPDLVTVSVAEKVVIPVLYLAFYVFFPLAFLRGFKDRNAALAIGTFILMRRDVYDRVGGHGALRDEIVEDMHLARLVKAEGQGVELLDGTGRLFTRFYSSAAEIWQGFSKNTFGAFGYTIAPAVATLTACYFVLLNPFVRFALSPAWDLSNPFFTQILLILFIRLALAVRTRHSILSVIFHPVMVCFALGFAFNSIWKIARGSPVAWKGRAYKITR